MSLSKASELCSKMGLFIGSSIALSFHIHFTMIIIFLLANKEVNWDYYSVILVHKIGDWYHVYISMCNVIPFKPQISIMIWEMDIPSLADIIYSCILIECDTNLLVDIRSLQG